MILKRGDKNSKELPSATNPAHWAEQQNLVSLLPRHSKTDASTPSVRWAIMLPDVLLQYNTPSDLIPTQILCQLALDSDRIGRRLSTSHLLETRRGIGLACWMNNHQRPIRDWVIGIT